MAEPLDPQLEALVTRPREDLHIEIKNWVDLTGPAGKATMAKAIIALANHGGGFVVIGLAERDDGTFAPADSGPPNLNDYSQDGVNGVVQAYAAPVFHCAVHHVAHPATGDRFPVIQVPGGHKVPVQAIKGSPDQRTLVNGKYYIRRQGPKSAEPATAEEWRDLVMRCVRAGRDDLLDAIRDVLAGHVPEATSAPTVLEDLQEWANAGIDKWRSLVPGDQYGNPALPLGFYCVAYAIDGSFERPSLVELSSILKLSTVHHTGWPAWWLPSTPDVEPQPIDGMLECDMGVTSGRLISDPPHADFWRASPEGRLLLIRGLLEDNPDDFEPGQIFSLTTPIWRAGECLLHAAAVATNLGAPEAHVVFTMRWSGLRGRELQDVERRRDIRAGRVAQQDEIELSITIPAGSIDDGLPEIVYELLRPLYELFSLFELPRFLVEEELRKMRAHRF